MARTLDDALRPVRPPEILYHYTTQEGLLGIANCKVLWTSDIFYLNDFAEFGYTVGIATEALRNAIKARPSDKRGLRLYQELLRTLPNAFSHVEIVPVGSFSETPDLLSQWRAYGGERGGFSVGFNSSTLLAWAQRQNFRLVKCIYDPAVQRRILEKLTERAYRGFEPLEKRLESLEELRYFLCLVDLASIFKHPSFREESEWRLVGDGLLHAPPIKLRPGKSFLIPYTEFRLSSKGHPFEIASVHIGPTPYPEHSSGSVSMLIRRFSGDRKVLKSRIPYRNW